MEDITELKNVSSFAESFCKGWHLSPGPCVHDSRPQQLTLQLSAHCGGGSAALLLFCTPLSSVE